jgi:DNA helicase TIP49 (TBP-interacting protein)
MIWHPEIGQRVQLRYRRSMQDVVGLHLKTGTIIRVANGTKTINAEVRLDNGKTVIVPRGNLFKYKD